MGSGLLRLHKNYWCRQNAPCVLLVVNHTEGKGTQSGMTSPDGFLMSASPQSDVQASPSVYIYVYILLRASEKAHVPVLVPKSHVRLLPFTKAGGETKLHQGRPGACDRQKRRGRKSIIFRDSSGGVLNIGAILHDGPNKIGRGARGDLRRGGGQHWKAQVTPKISWSFVVSVHCSFKVSCIRSARRPAFPMYVPLLKNRHGLQNKGTPGVQRWDAAARASVR